MSLIWFIGVPGGGCSRTGAAVSDPDSGSAPSAEYGGPVAHRFSQNQGETDLATLRLGTKHCQVFGGGSHGCPLNHASDASIIR